MHPTADHAYFRNLFGAGRLFEGAVLINLDSRPDRLERSLSELRRYGIDDCVTRMSAYEHEDGMYGCSVSHLEAVRLARRNRWKSVLIFEDDIKISDGFAEFAPGALGDLAAREWGLFQFGAMNPNPIEFVTPRLFRFEGGQAAHAFALHERTYDFLIDDYVCELDRGNWDEPAHYPFDEYLNHELASAFSAYGSTKLLISQHAGVSDTCAADVDYRDMLEHAYEKIRVPARSVVSFADVEVAIEWSRPEHGDLVASLFGSTASDEHWTSPADFRIESQELGQPALWRGGALIYAGESERALGQQLLEAVEHDLAGHARGGVLLRAAALIVGSRGLLLPGEPGVARTALMTSLLSEEDSGYLTHELVFIPEGEQRISGFGRPLELAHGSRAASASSVGHELSGGSCPPPVEIDLILFPAREQGREPELRSLSGAEAGLRLMAAVSNKANLPGHGFGEVARLARSAPAVELRCDDFGQLTEPLRALVAEVTARDASGSPR